MDCSQEGILCMYKAAKVSIVLTGSMRPSAISTIYGQLQITHSNTQGLSYSISSQPVGCNPLGTSISDIYITMCNNSKISYKVARK